MTDANDQTGLAQLAAQVGPWLDSHTRPGWKPTFEPAVEGRGFSWYGPLPGRDANSAPRCGDCDGPMELILGIDLGTVPAELGHPLADGVVEVHYCGNAMAGECDAETWEPYSAGHDVRLVPAGAGNGVTPPARVITWDRVDDRPDRDDLVELGATISFAADDFHFAVPDAGIDVDGIGYGPHLDQVIGTPSQGDKLGGWPSWVQYREHPSCRECGDEMAHLYQLDYGGPHDLMFGDAGCAYVSYCPTHPDVMTLLWQCH